jgi:hypothetical protein
MEELSEAGRAVVRRTTQGVGPERRTELSRSRRESVFRRNRFPSRVTVSFGVLFF